METSVVVTGLKLTACAPSFTVTASAIYLCFDKVSLLKVSYKVFATSSIQGCGICFANCRCLMYLTLLRY